MVDFQTKYQKEIFKFCHIEIISGEMEIGIEWYNIFFLIMKISTLE